MTRSTKAGKARTLEAAGDYQGIFTDPTLFTEYRAIFEGLDTRHFVLSNVLAGIAGVVEGIALLFIIPTVTALATGGPAWGLTVGWWVVILTGIAALAVVLTYFQQMYGYLATLTVFRQLHNKLGIQLAKMPLGKFGPKLTGSLSRLVTSGMMAVGQGLAHFLAPILTNAAAGLTMLVGCWIWRWELGLALTIAAPVMYLMSTAARYLDHRNHLRYAASDGELANRLVESAACQPALRASGRAHDFAPLEAAVEQVYRNKKRGLWWGVLGNMLTGMTAQMTAVAMIFIATALVTGATMTPVETIAFIGISLRFTHMLSQMGAFLSATENSRRPIREMKRIITAPQLPEVAEPAILTAPGEIRAEHVTFGYDSEPVLHDISFAIQPRSLTAIVGPSGCGKTTIYRLIARFWDVDSGAMMVGGVDVREQTTEQLMAQLSMVFQDVYLYNDTLENNIWVGNPAASREEVRQVARLAGVEEIIERLPRGWDTPVGERGGKLSGGERQRVSVARALLKHAPIVLFDEATSALDRENEAHIEDSIRQLRQESTVVVIAHKLDTVREADQIIVLDETGSVTQIGTHEQLVDVPGVYRTFWQARVKASGWSLGATSSD